MKVWKGIFVVLAIVAMAATASAQTKTIGVYWDEDATMQFATRNGGVSHYHTAYVFACDCNQQLGGVSFKLDIDPRISLMSAEYPNAIKFGEPQSGISIGFTDCRPAWNNDDILCAELTLWTGMELMTDAEIKVVAHPIEGLKVADCDAGLSDATGTSAFLTVTVDDDNTSWGHVKSLYR